MLVDSHCHLDFPEFIEDFDAVLARAQDAGIGAMLTICTHLSRFEQVKAVAAAHDHIFCSVGVHPHEAEEEGVGHGARLVELASHHKVVGIGETGLDFYYEHSPREAQKRSFQAHIDAARDSGLPLIVHTRDADTETMEMLRAAYKNGPFSGLIHCFSTSREMAECALDLGLYISLSGILTFKAADELRAIARDVPLDRLLVETDAPFLAPVPRRGKRNEPSFVAHTAACLADLKGVAVAEIADATTNNFFKLFTKATRPG